MNSFGAYGKSADNPRLITLLISNGTVTLVTTVEISRVLFLRSNLCVRVDLGLK